MPKYRLKKDLLWLKAGGVLGCKEGFPMHFINGLEQRIDVLPLEYPDFFEPISEEEEKIEEAEKLLESKGAVITWPLKSVLGHTYRAECPRCKQDSTDCRTLLNLDYENPPK